LELVGGAGGITLNNVVEVNMRNNDTVAVQSISGNNTLSGPISLTAGGNRARFQSDAGSLTLSGGIANQAGTGLRVATLQGAGNGLLSGVISNGGTGGTTGLAKEGTGTWSLTGANTYTGGTTVSGGTLLVNNTTGSGTGNGVVTVNSGGTLGGTGTIDTSSTNSNVTFNIGSAISPGAGGAGTLTVNTGTGGMNLAAITSANNGGLKFDLNEPGTSDLVNFTSAGIGATLTLGTLDFADFTFNNLGGVSQGDVYTLFDAAQVMAASVNPSGNSGVVGGFNATLSLDNTTNFYVQLTIGAPAGLEGDYNNNSVVDAADYVLWRRGGTLQNDPTPGNQPGDYDFWRARFGNSTPGSGSGAGFVSNGAVPEPSTGVLLCLSVVSLLSLVRARPANRRTGA
jgi:autotransporter-associated beta strand protein